MITYREIAEFMLHLIQDEGVTDAQSHIGTMTAHEGLSTIAEHFNGIIVKTWGEIKPGQKCLYVYTDGDAVYRDALAYYFTLAEDMVALNDVSGQRVIVLPIAPEVCVTYKP